MARQHSDRDRWVGTWFDWEKADWLDVRIGDFDGDGNDDIAGRTAGDWWVSRYSEGRFLTTRWAMWSDLDWQDVTVGDFNGDGSDDIAGRYAGEWWIGISTGSSFVTKLWATWIEPGWSVVFAGDVNGIPAPSEAAFSTSTTSNLVAKYHFISGSDVGNGMLSEASRALATLSPQHYTPAAEIRKLRSHHAIAVDGYRFSATKTIVIRSQARLGSMTNQGSTSSINYW